MKPDTSKIRRTFTAAEIRARRLSEHEKPRRAKTSGNGRPRLTVVKSVSIRPEMAIQVARDLGEGNFSRGVVKACTRALMELDKERVAGKRYE